MILKKIGIENFRNIKSLKIDFSANSSGSLLDIESGNFINEKAGKILPKIGVLIGTNAIGKTNVLYALKFLNSFTLDKLNRIVAGNILLHNKKENKLNINERELNEEIDLFLKNLENDNDAENIRSFLHEKKNIIERIHRREASNDNKAIKISVVFWDSIKKEDVELNMIMDKANIEVSNTTLSKYPNKLFHVFNPQFFLLDQLLGHSNRRYATDKIVKLYKKIGGKKLLSLLQIADPSINKIFQKDNKILFMSDDSDLDIDFSSLSTGTKRFILLAAFILYANNKKGVFLIDEVELNLHRELAISLISAMNMVVNKNKNVSFLFTTHSPLILGENLNYKQVFEIKKNDGKNSHVATRLSTLFKAHESIEKKYKKGIISSFPSAAFAFDHWYEVINE